MRRGEAVCHAVTLGLAFVATAASLAATMSRGEVGALALIALASGGLMITIGRRFWRTLRGQHAGRSEEHKSELQSLMRSSYDVFCLKQKKYEENDAKLPYIITHK